MRSILAKIALILCGIVLPCLALEGLLAFFYPQQVYVTSTSAAFFNKYDPLLGWKNREGAEGECSTASGIPATFVRINQQGYRGRLLPLEKGKLNKRIIVLGDSNTFGYGIAEGQRFTDLLTGMLSADTEIINLGVFAYGTDQEALLLEQEGIKYHPDTVLLAVSAGDLSDTMSSISGGNSKPFFRFDDDTLTLHNTPVPPVVPYMRNKWVSSSTVSLLYRHSHLFRLIMKRVTPVSRYLVNTVPEMSENEALKVMSALIQGMNDLCVTSRARFAVVLIPHGTWLKGARRMPGQTIGYYGPLSASLEAMGIPFVNTTRALAEVDTPAEPVFFAEDPVHLTSRGNRVVAQVVSAFIAERKLLSK